MPRNNRITLGHMERVAAAAIIDAQGRVAGWSEGARLLTGRTAQEVVGRPATDLLAEDLPSCTLAAQAGTLVLRHRDGRRVELALTACPVLGPDGAPTGYVVTADPLVPAAAELAAQALQQASTSMSVFDLQQRYLRVNAAACHVMGVPEATLVGRFYPETVEDAEHSRGFLRHLRQVAETGRPLRYESFTSAPALNRDHAWSIEMWPLRDASGEPTAVALAAFDSSEQYWARRRLALPRTNSSPTSTTWSPTWPPTTVARRSPNSAPPACTPSTTRAAADCCGSPSSPSAGAAGRRAAARRSGRNSRCPMPDHWNGQPGFGASSENGEPCGST
ncbi:PAS domain-containing protein [Streptomyces sp. Ag109_G2-15]|nr:PAS domain-containing protein [Streptomyces sp. Ag109_G2-15]